MEAVLISIRPEWCELIAKGQKTVEVRKNKPKLETPFKCYIYCTKGYLTKQDKHGNAYRKYCNGEVIGEFVCDAIERFSVPYPAYQAEMQKRILHESCCTYQELHKYAGHADLYGWHISDLVIYDKPKQISEFIRSCNKEYDCFLCDKSGFAPDMHIACFNTLIRPPQSWCYVNELCEGVE